MFLEGSANVR